MIDDGIRLRRSWPLEPKVWRWFVPAWTYHGLDGCRRAAGYAWTRGGAMRAARRALGQVPG